MPESRMQTAGKTLFTDLIQGSVALKEGSVKCTDSWGCPIERGIKSLVFKDIYSMSGIRTMMMSRLGR